MATLSGMAIRVTASTIQCPECKARGGEPCISRVDQRTMGESFHRERYEAAKVQLVSDRPALTDEQIARVCYEANRAYCRSIGDNTIPSWDEAEDWRRSSVLGGVRYHRENPQASPVDSHNEWMRAKRADGWKYGPAKDPVQKQHPCMVPYDALPPEQRAKDHLFIAVFHALTSLRWQRGLTGL
jgi:hypothetical protein